MSERSTGQHCCATAGYEGRTYRTKTRPHYTITKGSGIFISAARLSDKPARGDTIQGGISWVLLDCAARYVEAMGLTKIAPL
ncbi:MAG: hypothetical protein QNI87_03365 [Erythrobacter sp.]|uniref:hypothetical protein n=1 Tax=Erythrobacter sp. TaxID=1042 RepID=UPI002630A010|nr:hypothetical protein [Erythrobacter sp.]MDJ0977551.1 hypothetical protein [Erythrobacter sp.]